ncbi:MAG: tRNA (guanine-N(7)-)-methyltransferase [Lysobacterales bacterium]|jgi:tRNA (guanine-N7-)-methyltransferase|nr:MAG: tRNA (guanine-N(7)-)-methyltransferase [Xanthomonadales bacterium]
MDGSELGAPQRRIRSFVLREGRITPAQQRALIELWPRYGLEAAALADPAVAFGREARRVLEIGFGCGEALLAAALADPTSDFLGIEVHRPGVGRLLLAAARAQITNLRVVIADAVEAIEHLPAGALAEVRLFFPDPWPKKRHRKRRLIQPPFVERLARILVPGGRLLIATDWEDYAHEMLAVLEASTSFRNAIGPGRFAPRPPERPLTRFERRGLERGHRVHDLLFLRVPD